MIERTFLAGLSDVHRLNGIVLEVSHRFFRGNDTAVIWMSCRIPAVRDNTARQNDLLTFTHDI